MTGFMRILGVTETCDLAALYLRLNAEGHEVRLAIHDPLARGTLAGMISRVDDWRAELDWVRAAESDGLILFESVSEGFGALQDELRRAGFNVIGGSAYGDRLENDRAYAQRILQEIGLSTAAVWEFSDAAGTDVFIAANPARYVLKSSGAGHSADDTYVGQLADGADVRAMLKSKLARRRLAGSFVLMEHLDGIELGVGAYFDGEDFIMPACIDWEHKRFFAGDLGELTGEMGTVATFERTQTLFDCTLAKIGPLLRSNGHVGYVNLNMMANERGLWPLEFTCRFGYPGFAVLDPLQERGWGELFRAITDRRGTRLATKPGFSVGIVVTTPPFPYSRHQIDAPVGLPVIFDERLSSEDFLHLHYGEVGQEESGLVTSGLYGWTMVVTGTASTIAAARKEAYARVQRVLVPNARYRLDIGQRLIEGQFAQCEELGLLDPA